MMSIGVRFETSLPKNTAMTTTKNTARGPPCAPRALAAKPTASVEYMTNGGAFMLYAIAAAIAAPCTA